MLQRWCYAVKHFDIKQVLVFLPESLLCILNCNFFTCKIHALKSHLICMILLGISHILFLGPSLLYWVSWGTFEGHLTSVIDFRATIDYSNNLKMISNQSPLCTNWCLYFCFGPFGNQQFIRTCLCFLVFFFVEWMYIIVRHLNRFNWYYLSCSLLCYPLCLY